MELCLTYDMRTPDFGAKRNRLYDAALDQVAWADDLGFDLVGLGEHHGSEDGYNPSPLILASAMAARTRNLKIRTSVLLAPLYDLPKLAEDAAVTQTISSGRLLLGIGAGYRPSEFETFGRDLKDRWKFMGETCQFLRLAWTGEPFEWQGRRCHITLAAPRTSLMTGSRHWMLASGHPTGMSALPLAKLILAPTRRRALYFSGFRSTRTKTGSGSIPTCVTNLPLTAPGHERPSAKLQGPMRAA